MFEYIGTNHRPHSTFRTVHNMHPNAKRLALLQLHASMLAMLVVQKKRLGCGVQVPEVVHALIASTAVAQPRQPAHLNICLHLPPAMCCLALMQPRLLPNNTLWLCMTVGGTCGCCCHGQQQLASSKLMPMASHKEMLNANAGGAATVPSSAA